MASPGTLTFEDWDELLQLDGMVTQLADGQLSPDSARETLSDRRAVYPGHQFDYIRVIEAFGEVLDQFEEAIEKQNEALDDFNSSAEEIGEQFDWDRLRLLTESEREDFTDVQRDIARHAEDLASEAEAAADEAEDLESQLEALIAEAESTEFELEDIQSQIEEIVEQLEAMAGED